MVDSNELEVFKLISGLFLSISDNEHTLQCIRQVLTLNPSFSPMTTFKYITKGNQLLTKKNILNFLQQNNFDVTEQQVNFFFKCYGYGQQIKYTKFLNYIYPTNSWVIRQLSTGHLKKYKQTQKTPIQQDTVTTLFILLSQEIKFIRKFQQQKTDFFLKTPKQNVRKILKCIKQVNQKQQSTSDNKNNMITTLDFKNFMRLFVNLSDYQFFHLVRKLNIKNNEAVLVQQLQFWIKPWKKDYQKQNQYLKHQQKQFNEEEYRQSLQKELVLQQQNCNQKINLKNKSSKINNTKSQIIIKFKQLLQKLIFEQSQLQKLRKTINTQFKINLNNIFKKIDKWQHGVINSEDIQKFYYSIGGAKLNISFNLLVQKYSHSQNNDLLFRQFQQIFNSSQEQQSFVSKQNNYINKQCYQLITQVIKFTLQSQNQIRKIKNMFKQQQAQQLFQVINQEKSGFINYQQMRKFTNMIEKKLSMQQLMIVLKTLDRSKNGVILKKEFLAYFKCK